MFSLLCKYLMVACLCRGGLGGAYACVENPLFLMILCTVSNSSVYSLCCRW